MARSKRTCTNVIAFPKRDKGRKPVANNWVFRIVESNEALVVALGVILESYKSVVAGQPVCNTAVIKQVEKVLRSAQDVKWDAIR
jgi:hypothetical protein